MRKYELLYILKHDSAPEKTDTTRAKMLDIIQHQGGIVVKEDVWGKKKLAFEVKKYQKGIYILVVFLAEPPTVAELERNLKINAEVLRFLTVKLADKIDLEAEKAEKQRWEAEQEEQRKLAEERTKQGEAEKAKEAKVEEEEEEKEDEEEADEEAEEEVEEDAEEPEEGEAPEEGPEEEDFE